MKRPHMLGFATAAAVLLIPVPVGAQVPDSEAFIVQEARAEWFVRTDEGLRIFVIYADRWSYQHSPTEPGLPGTSAMVARGPCRLIHSGHEIECRPRVIKKDICLDQFWIDPLLGEANATFELRGRRHWVEWRASDTGPTAQHSAYARVGAAGGGLAFFRRATARGELFGRALTERTSWLHEADLAQRTVADSTFLPGGRRDIYVQPLRGSRGAR